MTYDPDPVKRAEAWDRCYPGNVSIEAIVDDLRAEVVRLRQKLSTIQDPTEEGVIADIVRLRVRDLIDSAIDDESDAWGESEEMDPDKRMLSEIRLYGLSWLGKLWSDKEAMLPVARAILARIKSITT